jgi:glycosyltransferase involved in cell wall biosynthesis
VSESAAVQVSIIMPAYNRERFVAAAIESVFAQTFGDWELIFIDDGSKDRTLAIAEQFRSLQPHRMRIITQANAGVVAARNAGIRVARGTLTAFLDSDDIWAPDKLELQVALFRTRPDLAFVYSGYELMDEAGRPQGGVVRPDPAFQGDIRERLWLEPNTILGATLVIPTALLFRIGLFDDQLKGAENLDLRAKLVKLGPVAFVGNSLYRYRKHSATLTGDRRLMLQQHRMLIEKHFPSDANDRALRAMRRRVLARYWQLYGNDRFESEAFAAAFAAYCRAWPFSREKLAILGRMARCFMGSAGNAALRRLKQHRSTIASAKTQQPGNT